MRAQLQEFFFCRFAECQHLRKYLILDFGFTLTLTFVLREPLKFYSSFSVSAGRVFYFLFILCEHESIHKIKQEEIASERDQQIW